MKTGSQRCDSLRKGTHLLSIGFIVTVFVYRYISCGYIELFAEKKE